MCVCLCFKISFSVFASFPCLLCLCPARVRAPPACSLRPSGLCFAEEQLERHREERRARGEGLQDVRREVPRPAQGGQDGGSSSFGVREGCECRTWGPIRMAPQVAGRSKGHILIRFIAKHAKLSLSPFEGEPNAGGLNKDPKGPGTGLVCRTRGSQYHPHCQKHMLIWRALRRFHGNPQFIKPTVNMCFCCCFGFPFKTVGTNMYKLLADLMNMGRSHFLGAPRRLLEAPLRSSYFASFGRPAALLDIQRLDSSGNSHSRRRAAFGFLFSAGFAMCGF